MSERPSWDNYFMSLAKMVSSRSTCNRKQVGAVVVKDKNILATGFNGSISGEPHCDEAGCLMVDGKCVRTIHAELNAIAQAAKHGVNIDGATLYVTMLPCWICFKTIVNAGIKKIVYGEIYDHAEEVDLITMTAWNVGVPLERLEEERPLPLIIGPLECPLTDWSIDKCDRCFIPLEKSCYEKKLRHGVAFGEECFKNGTWAWLYRTGSVG